MDSLVCARQTGKVKTALVSLMALAMLTARGEDAAGHYILKGVMEVGSELLLKSDGSFEYTLAYGAADYWAKGTWRHKDNSVVLNSAGRKEAVFPGVANARAVAFEVPVYSIKAGPFEIKPSDNDFYFEINGDAITEVLFKDEELAIDGKDLVMKYWNQEQPMRYEKQ